MDFLAFFHKILTGCFITVLLFSTQAHSATMNVEFSGLINLAPLGGDSRTPLNGSFEFYPISNSPLSDFQMTVGNDSILLNDVIDYFEYELNSGAVVGTLLVSYGGEELEGSILDNEILSMEGVFGFNNEEMMNELIQNGYISPSVLTLSKLTFGITPPRGRSASRPLIARIDSINVSAVPLPNGFILMLSGLGLFLILIFFQHRKSFQEHNGRWQASAM